MPAEAICGTGASGFAIAAISRKHGTMPAPLLLRIVPAAVLGLGWAVLLGFASVECAAAEPSARADSAVSAEPASDLRLRERIRAMVEGIEDVPLPLIIEALSDCRVIPWRGEAREVLESAARQIPRLIEDAGIETARMNEAGNRVEAVVVEALRGLGAVVARPRTASGRMRSAGYPDLEADIDGRAFYIEVKTFSAATVDSSQRSFYLSPSTDFKVTHDAIHLLVAVELSPGPEGSYRAKNVRWLDLSGLRCDLKYEFNASNRDLYRDSSELVILERPAEPAAIPSPDDAEASPPGTAHP